MSYGEPENKWVQTINDLTLLMLGQHSFPDKVNKAFNLIGGLVEADRIYLFKNYFEENQIYTSQIFEWTKGSVSKQIENPVLNRIGFDNFPSLYEKFLNAEHLHTIVAQIPNPGLREILHYQEIKSIVLIPILFENKIWGFAGFDNCTSESLWPDREVSLLQLFTGLIAANVYRYQPAGDLNILVDYLMRPAAVFDEFLNLTASNGFYSDYNKVINTELVKEKINEAIYHLSKSNEENTYTFTLKSDQTSLLYQVSKLNPKNADEYLNKEFYLLVINSANQEIEKASNTVELNLVLKNKEMEFTISHLNTFVNRIVHDLKSPVRNIRRFASLLKEMSSNNLSDDAINTYLSNIDLSSLKIQHLIESLSAFSKAGSKEVTLSHVHTAPIMDYWFNQYKLDYGLENARLINNIIHEISGDEDLLNIAFSNIISNALKYSSKTADPVITTSSKKHGNKVEILIEDNGCGFDMKDYHRIFGFMERLHNDSEYTGSGIGLSTVRKIIDRLNGDIWLLSSPGSGTKLFMVFNSPETGSRVSKPD